MIFTFKIALVYGMYAQVNWEAVVELDSSTTLEDMHFIIQQAVGFDDDHMYAFFVARTRRSRGREFYDMEDGNLDTTRIVDLFPLEKNRKLFYWFDFGDDWMFRVSMTRRKPFEPKAGVHYPRLDSETGNRPEQYPAFE